MKLDIRLTAAFNEVKGDVLCDIGCDHGKLSARAILDDKAKRVIAVDKSAPSLDKARQLFAKLNISQRAEFIVSDGFDKVDISQVDCIVIAGIGGKNTIEILQKVTPKPNTRLVLIPHRNADSVYEFLAGRGFVIIKNQKVYEKNKVYDLIVCDSC